MYPLRESCGVVAVYDAEKPVAERIFYGLMALQHRGQESAGVAVTEGTGNIYLKKAMGLVGEILPLDELFVLGGKFGIGHVRYSTVGKSSLAEAQPFNLGDEALCYNGNLVNYLELRKVLAKEGEHPSSQCDTEILLRILKRRLRDSSDFVDALSELAKVVEGSYSAAYLNGKGETIVFRDPYGFKPLCYSKFEDCVMCASESVALGITGVNPVSDVQPGEALLISDSSVERKIFAPCKKRAYCMFEYVYFSRPDSIIEGKSVYDVRLNLGKNLAKTFECDADVIVPVPDTSRPAAEGMSRLAGIPVAEGLIKNRYIQRTFIMPKQMLRENAVKIKLNPLRSVLENQRVLLVDDSIVRGTTILNIVRMIRMAGAREVHLRITCPPITSPCFYGIDISTHKELIAAGKSIEEIRRKVEADSLGYQTIKGLVDAIGLRKEELCLACLTGKYPTPRAQKIADRMKLKPPHQEARYIEIEA